MRTKKRGRDVRREREGIKEDRYGDNRMEIYVEKANLRCSFFFPQECICASLCIHYTCVYFT